MNKTFYITTPIFYASGKPQLGNSYTTILTDAIARYKRLNGYDVIFQTGMDEHGQKVEQTAKTHNKAPQEFVDEIALEVKQVLSSVDISYDRFIRTTNPAHKEKVRNIFQKLYDQGDIYKGKYEGLYCTPCESFFTEKELIDGKCPDCGREVHKESEEAYFFKLSKYQDRLIKYIEDHPEFIKPESRKNEMINNFLKPGLQDLCVSRTSFKWGVPVDFDSEHVVYVWIDALTNYITNIGYDPDGSSEEFEKYWPCDLHLVGKDIIRFHTIYWPIILMALDLPLPKQVFGHPWLLFGSDKMSKSKGNIIYADDLVKYFGCDAVRYYVLHEIPYANDGTITYDLIIEKINTDLANILGNLVNRTIAMANKYFDGKIENKKVNTEFDNSLITMINELDAKIDEKMNNLEVGASLDLIFDLLKRSNKYIDETSPWVLAKDENEKDKLKTVLYNLLESIRVAAIELKPFLPETSEKIIKQLNTSCDIRKFEENTLYETGTQVPLFQRIDKDKKLEEIKGV